MNPNITDVQFEDAWMGNSDMTKAAIHEHVLLLCKYVDALALAVLGS